MIVEVILDFSMFFTCVINEFNFIHTLVSSISPSWTIINVNNNGKLEITDPQGFRE